METDQMIATENFCEYYNVTDTFVQSLVEMGLIETLTVREVAFIHMAQLQKIERILRLHQELNINLEGIEAVHLLLDRIAQMDEELLLLKNRLRFYEQI